jgi:alpha-galactosidase
VDLGSVVTRSNRRWGLLDYGRLEVQDWVGHMMDRYIRELDLRYIRYDFNIDPLLFWDAHDLPNRRGITQLRHIRGLYAILDGLRERHPNLILEGCASGGRRIDLEMARRFHTFWISDYTVDPAIVRFHLFGINHFLPGNYSYVQYTLPHPRQKNFQADDFGFQCMFGGAMGTGGHVDLWSEEMKEKARGHFAVHKKIRRYLVEDYYSLSEQPGDLASWSGWQFDDPQDRSGFIQTFRTNTSGAAHRFFVKGLESQACYRFTDAYGADSFEMTGQAAMQVGIEFTQEPMSSKVFTYRKISERKHL